MCVPFKEITVDGFVEDNNNFMEKVKELGLLTL